MFRAYSTVLLTRHVPPRLIAVFLSAVPLGMMSLTIVLAVQEWTGTLRSAGLITGLFSLGNAIGLNVQGRIIDSAGPRTVVATAGGVSTAALLGFALAGTSGAPLWILAALAGIAGVAVPAITAAVRAWLPTTLTDPTVRAASYALLSVLFQSAVMVGPVLVSLALLLRGPTTAIVIAAVLIAAAAGVYVILGGDTQRPRKRNGEPQPVIHARTPGLTTLLVGAGLVGIATGVTAVAIPGVMTAAGLATLAGFAFAAAALGEVLGAITFGSRAWPGTRSGQLPVIEACVALIAVLTFAAAHEPWLLLPVMFLGGAIGSPVTILNSALLDDVVEDRALARSYSLLVAVGLVSAAMGNSLAGLLAEHIGVTGLLILPAIAVAGAAIWTRARWHTLAVDRAAQPSVT